MLCYSEPFAVLAMQMGNCNYCRSRELCGWWEAGAAKLGKSVGNTGRSVSASLLLCLSRKRRKASALPNPKALERCDAVLGKRDAAVLSLLPPWGMGTVPADGSALHPRVSTRARQVTPEAFPAPHPISERTRGDNDIGWWHLPKRSPTTLHKGTDPAVPDELSHGGQNHAAWQTPEDCANLVPSTRAWGTEDAKKQHLLLPLQTHPDHLTDPHPCQEPADHVSLGTTQLIRVAGQPPGLPVHAWAAKEGEAGGDAHRCGGNPQAAAAAQS